MDNKKGLADDIKKLREEKVLLYLIAFSFIINMILYYDYLICTANFHDYINITRLYNYS